MNKITRLSLCVIVITTALFTALIPAGVTATTTFFNSKSSDGMLYAVASNANGTIAWALADGAVNANVVDATSNSSYAIASGNFSTNYIAVAYRGGLLFDTSSLPDTAIVSSANVQLYVTSKKTDMKADSNINLQCANAHNKPSDPIVVADFDTTLYPNDCATLALSSISTNQYNTWTLNAAGITAISLTSITRYIVREEWYDIDGNTISYGSGTYKEQGIIYYNYEAGSSYYPILNITYTLPANPTITALAATSVASTGAVLNGTIVDDGGYPAGVAVKWGYGTTSQTAANFASYDTVDAGFAGAFSTGSAVSKTLAGGALVTGTTYYYRFQAQNTNGTTTSTDEITFTTLSVPVITAITASNIAQTSARLNSQLNNYGGAVCEVSWGYGTTSQIAADFHHYDTITAFAGSYVTGNAPYFNASGLTAATPYYYRLQVRNSVGTFTSNDEITFTTETTVGTPAEFVGIPTATTIKLTWSSGTGGASQYMVRVQSGAFPTTIADGALVYFGTALTTTAISLTPGQVYYYSVWGESGGTYSASYAECMVVTTAGSTSTSTGVPISAPWRWMSAPDYTNLSNIPVAYDAVNGVADAIGMPRETFWMLIALMSSALGGIMAYVGSGQSGRGQTSQAIGMIFGLVLLVLWYAVEIVPFYIIVLDILWVVTMLRTKREMD